MTALNEQYESTEVVEVEDDEDNENDNDDDFE